MIARRPALALLLALALAPPRTALAAAQGVEEVVATAEDEAPGAERAWYLPDHAKLQLAGDIGFLSPGLGWELAGRRVHVDVFAGWVPEAIGGDDIYSASVKVAYAPWHLAFVRWRLEPVRVGAQLTYTFGRQYFLVQPGRYPGGYYEVPTALHAGASLGGAVSRAIGRGGERELGVYWEVVALAQAIRDHLENPDVVDAREVVSLALGTVLRF